MMYICLIIVLLLAVLFVCVYLYRRHNMTPEQKLLNKLIKMNKILKNRMQEQEKNKEKMDECIEQIWQKIRDNEEKLKRMRDDINNRNIQ